ncbi:MAG: polysaccharide biosynthesis C-terminal domain-containing protein, partial [Oscillospiraceae bacterium]|nr:polysaccharide biosynthesis C-terminal domain-containing protein [Oscillospiraceae bacterium]
SIGMVGYGIQNVLIRAFYAEKRGRMPLIAGLVSIVANVVLCWVLVDAMGVAGLALASAASLLTTALVLIPAAHKLLGGGLVTGKLALELVKMGFAALVMGLAVWFVRDLLTEPLAGGNLLMRIGLVAAPTAIGLVVYFILAHVLGLDEIKVLLGYLRKRREGA